MTTTTTPAEEFASDVSSLQRDVESLHSDVKLSSLKDSLEDLGNTASELPQRVKTLRDRGYAFEKSWEGTAEDLAKRWKTLKPSLDRDINLQSSRLETEMRSVESQMAQVTAKLNNYHAGRPLYNQAKAKVDNLESRVNAASQTIRGQYDSYEQDVNQLTYQMNKVEWMLEQLEQASFQLMPSESGIMAVKATWLEDDREDKDDAKGVLYLTDQRLIFEQKEEVATKKVLFITTERKTVQEVDFEVPVALVEKVDANKKGLLKNEDHLDIHFASGAPISRTFFHIFGQDCKDWQSLLNRAKTKDFDDERAIELDQEVVEKVKSAPTECPSCGGKLDQVITRGMDTITCNYCGSVIRL